MLSKQSCSNNVITYIKQKHETLIQQDLYTTEEQMHGILNYVTKSLTCILKRRGPSIDHCRATERTPISDKNARKSYHMLQTG